LQIDRISSPAKNQDIEGHPIEVLPEAGHRGLLTEHDRRDVYETMGYA